MKMMDKTEQVLMRDANFYWKRYEKGRDYIDRKNLVEETTQNWNFFIGNQWEGLETGSREKPPFYNFIKRHVEHKVSTISQSSMTVRYSDLEGRGNPDIYEKLNDMYESCREKANLNLLDRQTLKEGAVTGDGFQYFGTDDVKDVQRLVNTQVLFGDESEQDIQKQPYITIEERLPVEVVRQIATENGKSPEEIQCIVADDDTDRLVGNRDELEFENRSPHAKVTCLINLEKVDGVVWTCRSTKTLVFEDMHPLTAENEIGDTRSMTLYPVVRFSWEDYPNSARGVSEVKPMIPNQIELNKTLARISMTIKQMAFPRLAVDANAVINKEQLNKVGGIIELNSGEMQSVSQMIQYLQPAQFSSEPRMFAENLLTTTQELSGSGETSMGNINPNRVAASAYTAIRDQANLILGEKEERAIQFVEDRARLFVEMWTVYGSGGYEFTKEVIDDMTGEITTETIKITAEELAEIKPDVRVDVSKTDAWSKEAEQQYIDTLLDKQQITFEEAIDLYSDTGIVPKQKLRLLLARRKQKEIQQQQAMLEQQNMMNSGEMSEQDIADQAVAQWEEQDDNNEPQMQ